MPADDSAHGPKVGKGSPSFAEAGGVAPYVEPPRFNVPVDSEHKCVTWAGGLAGPDA